MDILILLGLIGLSAIISTAEIGFFSVNETRLKALAQNGSKRAAKALQLRSDPQKLFSTILVGDRLVSTAIPMFATFITLNAYGGKSAFEEAIAVMVGILTFVLLVSVDVIPKTLAAKFSVPVTLNMAYPIYWVQVMLRPASFLDRPADLQFDGRKGVDASLGDGGRAEDHAGPRRKGRRDWNRKKSK